VMPAKALRACGSPGCPALTAGRFCSSHQQTFDRARWGQMNGARGTVTEQGYGAAHRRWAAAVLARHPICPCGALATVADHVIPLRQGGTQDLSNGQGLCTRCHQRKRGREAAQMRKLFEKLFAVSKNLANFSL